MKACWSVLAITFSVMLVSVGMPRNSAPLIVESVSDELTAYVKLPDVGLTVTPLAVSVAVMVKFTVVPPFCAGSSTP